MQLLSREAGASADSTSTSSLALSGFIRLKIRGLHWVTSKAPSSSDIPGKSLHVSVSPGVAHTIVVDAPVKSFSRCCLSVVSNGYENPMRCYL